MIPRRIFSRLTFGGRRRRRRARVIAIALLLGLAACPGGTIAGASCPAAPLGRPAFQGLAVLEICHEGYFALLDPAAKEARVVTYALTSAHSHGNASRKGMSFKPDPLAPPEDQGRASDYAASGYDLGHLAPAEDFAWNARLERETFSMANVAPQLPDLNRQGWERLEEIARAEACRHGAIVIFTGPIYPGASTIGADRLAVPRGFFKLAIDPRRPWALAFLVEQAPLAKGDAAAAATSVVALETAAGMSFPLPAGISREAQTGPDPQALEDYRAGRCAGS